MKTIINITPAIPPVHMKTSVLMASSDLESESETRNCIAVEVEKTREYAPGYKTTVQLKKLGEKTMCQVQVVGNGDYLPAYAGNLDIINCAALEVIKKL